jgi:hypothetical protein
MRAVGGCEQEAATEKQMARVKNEPKQLANGFCDILHLIKSG